MPPSLHGNTRERMLEAVTFGENARRRVTVLGEPIKARVRREYAQRDRALRRHTHPDVVEHDANFQADNSPRVQWEIGKEQWGTRLTTMYAAVRTTEQLDRIIEQNSAIISLLAQLLNATRGVPPPDVIEAGLLTET